MSVRTRATVVTSNNLTDDQQMEVSKVLVHHGGVDKNTLAYVCLGCWTVGQCQDANHRDTFVEHFDVSCCGVTVVFHTSHTADENSHRLGRVPFGPWVEHSSTCKCSSCR